MLPLIFWNGLLELVFWFILVSRYLRICPHEVSLWKRITFSVHISHKMSEENYSVSEMTRWSIVTPSFSKSFVLNMFSVRLFHDLSGLKWRFAKKHRVRDGRIHVDGRPKCRNTKLLFLKKFPRAKCGRATILKLAHERKDFHRSVSGGSRSYDMKDWNARMRNAVSRTWTVLIKL